MFGRDDLISLNERRFLTQAIEKGIRVDGRGVLEYRHLKIELGTQWGHVLVELGNTKILVVVSYEVVKPEKNYPTEGFFKFNISFSPIASPAFGNRVSIGGVEIGRVVERGLRGSGVIDSEALCIIAGQKVWSIQTDTYILDDDGNMLDCCAIGVTTALHHFRRPDISVNDREVIMYSEKERIPVPLSIYAMPICISFALYSNGTFVVDPNWKEENTMDGRFSITLSVQNEIYCIQKAGGMPLSAKNIMELTKIAQSKVLQINSIINSALIEDIKNKNAGVAVPHRFVLRGIGVDDRNGEQRFHCQSASKIN